MAASHGYGSVAPRLRMIAGLLVVLFLAWHSARTGYATLLTKRALANRDPAAAQAAVQLSPGDPNAQVIFGVLLEASDDRTAAISHYQKAVALRPIDYVLWMQLARGQELAGHAGEAIKSERVAVSLAPYYVQPRWQLGNMLVRSGRADEGFQELRLAGASDSTLLPATIDLAWQLSGGNVAYVLQTVQPETPNSYKSVIDYLKRRGQVAAAIDLFVAAGNGLEPERQAYVGELISAKRFEEAHLLWSAGHPITAENDPIFDPGFEREINLSEPGFGWQAVAPTSAFALSLDTSKPQQGRSSLRADFKGEQTNADVVSQFVLVKPNTHYQLSMGVRTENLVSGGPPIIVIADSVENRVLAQTMALTKATAGWHQDSLDFTTGPSTTAIQIVLRRQPCPTKQCPIFGKLWLDSFSLTTPR